MSNLKRILLVDPAPESRVLLARVAAEMGATLDTASDGEDALLAVGRAMPDVVVLASQVGRLSAPELIMVLKGKSLGRILPVILVVADDDARQRFASFDSGADDYVRAPMQESELVPRLRVFARVHDLEAQVAAAQEEIQRLVTVDDVTGTYGRRFIHTQVKLEWARAERYGEALSLVLMELLGLSGMRDQHGEAFTEAVLKDVAMRLAGSLRRCDLVSHVAWSRFLVVMPNTSTVGAYFAAEKMRGLVASRGTEHAGIKETIGVAVGVSTFQDGNFPGPEPLLSSAEEALRQAGTKGAGSVVLFHPVSVR